MAADDHDVFSTPVFPAAPSRETLAPAEREDPFDLLSRPKGSIGYRPGQAVQGVHHWLYILLWFVSGGLSAHNYYAKRFKQAGIQSGMTVLGLLLMFVPYLLNLGGPYAALGMLLMGGAAMWALFDVIFVREDGQERPFI